MHTMHPTLLIGPADWDRLRMPREEFQARIDALWRDDWQAGGAIIYGNPENHAELAYLTNFTPKLEAALALMPREGEAQLLVGGGVNMIPAAKPLTFVNHLLPLRDAAKTVAKWARELPAGSHVLTIGGDTMPYAMRRNLDDALKPDVAVEDGTAMLRAHMLRKRPHELAAIREAVVCLNAAVDALIEVHGSGAGVSAVVLAAEHAAYRHGAQDVRSLFSLDGGRTLQPFDVTVEQPVEPLPVYLAVRHTGYWAEGFVSVPNGPAPLLDKASSILRSMIGAARPGLSCRELNQIVEAGRGSLQVHPVANDVFGNSIGLSLEEAPLLSAASEATLEAGEVYSLRAGLIDEQGHGAIASAMLRVTEGGNEILWSAGKLP